MSITKNIAFLLILILPVTYLSGSNTNIRFERLSLNDGLSLSSVYCILQDSKGFMWFGTEDGLNKYDGHSFKVYRTNPYNSNSISHKWIEKIVEDSHGGLWFGSRGGLTHFNPKTEIFTQYKREAPAGHKISNDSITTITQIGPNSLLIGSQQGLNLIDLSTKECVILSDKIPELNTTINTVNLFKNQQVWIGTKNGVYCLDLQNRTKLKPVNTPGFIDKQIGFLDIQHNFTWIGVNNKIYRYQLNADTTAIGLELVQTYTLNGKIENFLVDNQNQVWVATSNGLHFIDSSLLQIKWLINAPNLSRSLTNTPYKPLIQDSENTIWFGTSGNGLYKITPSTKTFQNIVNNPVDLSSISENSINCIYQDKSGTIWFGTYAAGISAYNPSLQKFNLIKTNPLNPNSLASNFVWSIMEDKQGNVWIGTNDKGISIFNPKEDKYSFIKHIKGKTNSLPDYPVRELFQDHSGTIWIGTDGGGLSAYKPLSKTFKHYSHKPKEPNSISNNSVRVIFEDKDNMLWIGTQNGLNRFNKKTGEFDVYLNHPNNSNSLSHNFIYSVIHQDKQGFLWIGTYGGGLNRFDPQKETFISFQNDPNNIESLVDNIVFSIHESPDGNLWLGTNSGIDYFDVNTQIFTHFGIPEGLPNDVIYGIVPDDKGNLWLSTNYGICYFNTKDFSIQNYTLSDGLQSNEFNGGAFHAGKNGKIYFGGIYGLNILDTKATDTVVNMPKLVFTKLEIMGHEVLPLPLRNPNAYISEENKIIKISDNYYTPVAIAYSDEIILDYSNRNISIEFNDLSNPFNKNTRFAYYIDGIHKEWQFTGNRNYVSFANLNHGSYLLKVRAQNRNGSWETPEAILLIKILPPIYKTWWFIILEILIAFAIIFSINKILVRRKTYKILKAQNILVTESNNKLVKSERELKEINATKDKFFSIISHDLKNPITSLMCISELMNENYETFDESEKKSAVERINRSVNQIYSLLESLLTWSRTQSDRIEYKPNDFNISKVLKENINLYSQMAENKGIKIHSDYNDNIIAFGDREMINTVIRNLLNNAIKFTFANKSVFLQCTKYKGFIKVSITDQGIGISEENLSNLFKIDKKIKSAGTSGEIGTGLGLIICHEFVLKNKGEIKVESSPNNGSTFSFSIPGN